LNANFLGAWSDRILLSPFFVLYVKKGCDSPSVAMLTSQSVWNNRSVKAFILQHNTPVPTGESNDTSVRVPKSSLLCASRGCKCLKQHREKLDKKLKLNILVEEKQDGRDTVLQPVFAKEDQYEDQKDYSVLAYQNHKCNS